MKYSIYTKDHNCMHILLYTYINTHTYIYIYLCAHTHAHVFVQSKDYSDVIRNVSTNDHRLKVFLKQNHPDSSFTCFCKDKKMNSSKALVCPRGYYPPQINRKIHHSISHPVNQQLSKSNLQKKNKPCDTIFISIIQKTRKMQNDFG